MQEKGRGCLCAQVCLFKWKKMKLAAVEFVFFGMELAGFPSGKQQQACVLLNQQRAGGELILGVLLDPPVILQR